MTPDIARAVEDALLAIAPEADFATLHRDRPLRDQLDLDSFDFLNLLIALNGTLGIEVPEADYARVQSFDALVGYLAARVAPR